MILGIDEAGRGAVIGPMVIAGLLIDDEKKLSELGVRDSKELSPQKREDMEEKIKSMAKDFMLLKVPAAEIDESRKVKNLNEIEMDKMAQIINTIKPSKVVIDAPEKNTEKFALNMKSRLNYECEIIAENFADKKYPVVGGASILAKVLRDRSIRMLEDKIDESIGSGYPSDPLTTEFLERKSKKGEYPDYIRKTWLTVVRLKEKNQGSLSDFI